MQGDLTFKRESAETLTLSLSGNWKLAEDLPSADVVLDAHVASGPPLRRIAFNTDALADWDTGLLIFLTGVQGRCTAKNIQLDTGGLPEGAARLLELATAVPEITDTGKGKSKEALLARLGVQVLDALRSTADMLAFIGDAALAFGRLLKGKACFRRSDLVLIIQECGADALPIVSLISLLIGLILAFVGAVQLRLFGAEIYIASLVAIGMAREMGAMMAAIIMAGRTGAAFAAQLGTMQVNEEIDALITLGVSPMDFLVLPRMLALVLMMPLLTLYADLVGIIGGYIVGVAAFDISSTQYIEQTILWLNLRHIMVGVVKGGVFGVLIAVAGCLRGMQCGRSATEVGNAATSAVVTAIVWIIVTDGLFAIITNVLNV